jgi:energy-coupling factor transporter ATP-binding protein EcfA2
MAVSTRPLSSPAPSAGASLASANLRHISVRVPWHDNRWNGTVCEYPGENAECLALKQVNATRDDAVEAEHSGKVWLDLLDLGPKALPACADERGAFMAPFEHVQTRVHPYSQRDQDGPHGHIAPTPLRFPAFSAMAVPFRWTLRESAERLAERHGIPYSFAVEDRVVELMDGYQSNWVQDRDNQRGLLDRFFGGLEPQRSLVFFYAKRTPLSDEPIRTIVGVGRVTGVGQPVEYEYSRDGELRSMIWHRAVNHSIRPDGYEGPLDGFLLPYHQLLEHQRREDPSLDLSRFIAAAPEEGREQFSYGAEHVDHDVAIAALLACERALREASTVIRGQFDEQLAWLSARIGEVWRMRGPDPGLGSALVAFGMARGHRIAYEVSRFAGENESLWPLMDEIFDDPSILGDDLAADVSPVLCKTWKGLSEERRSLLKLLSRFDLTAPQALRYFDPMARRDARLTLTDRQVLENPYLLYECDRDEAQLCEQPEDRRIALETIDRGVFADPAVRALHPLPVPEPVTDPFDARRVRALAGAVLERGAGDGHTLLPQDDVIRGIQELPLTPPCSLRTDVLEQLASALEPTIRPDLMANGTPAYQLDRLAAMTDRIRTAVLKRIQAPRHEVTADWRALLDKALNRSVTPGDLAEERARQEKVAALAELAASRISVLIGPAGTGKTTLLSVLTTVPEIESRGVLLLAPTGKARVQLAGKTKLSAQTVAQFLLPLDRFEPITQTYRRSKADKERAYKTVIVDEASMLTEDQLGAVLDALAPVVERLILVGDPRQLPPIGAGRPFVDIVARLMPDEVERTFPRVGPGYAELTIRRRQDGQARDDLLLADWFGGGSGDAGADEIWARIGSGQPSDTLRFIQWKDADDLRARLMDALVEYLPLGGPDDLAGFGERLGGTVSERGLVFFNPNRGAPAEAEKWQILSPVHGQGHGVAEINRRIQRHFRADALRYARGRYRRTPKPMGPDEIVYGDKVMVTRNARRKYFKPREALGYIANGEIGVVVGDFKSEADKSPGRPWKLQVELSSQLDTTYSVVPKEMNEDGTPLLQLAYAITVHKSQGSEFGTTFLIVPEDCWLLSRELLYTALTRQRDRLVVLHQGPATALKRYASPAASETARRLTNLFGPPEPVKVEERFLEKWLIHQTRRGEAVRSKSEVIIADLLYAKGLEYEYERPLPGADGSTRYPDFTVDDAESGVTVYWEHLGLLSDPSYADRWERKLAWYREQGILRHEDGGGPNGTLIVSRDDERGGIVVPELERVVEEVFGL